MKKINIPDGLSEKLDSIEIKSPEEVIENECYGFMFAGGQTLKYMDFGQGKVYEIKRAEDEVVALTSGLGDVFYSEGKTVRALFDDDNKYDAANRILSLEYDGKQLIDCGSYGVTYHSGNDKVTMKDNETCFSSLFFNGGLYVLDVADKGNATVSKIEDENLKEVISYSNIATSSVRHKIVVVNGSVITNVYENWLDLNGKKIEGTYTNDSLLNIRGLELLAHYRNVAEVVYAGNMNDIFKVIIDINDGRILEKESMVTEYGSVAAMETIRDKEIHEKLVKVGSKKVVKEFKKIVRTVLNGTGMGAMYGLVECYNDTIHDWINKKDEED